MRLKILLCVASSMLILSASILGFIFAKNNHTETYNYKASGSNISYSFFAEEIDLEEDFNNLISNFSVAVVFILLTYLPYYFYKPSLRFITSWICQVCALPSHLTIRRINI